MTRVGATEFKARCLALMDRVAESRETYVITKRGKPVAKLVPADPEVPHDPFGCMADLTAFVGDIEKPAWSEEEWAAFEKERAAQVRGWEREWRARRRRSGR